VTKVQRDETVYEFMLEAMTTSEMDLAMLALAVKLRAAFQSRPHRMRAVPTTGEPRMMKSGDPCVMDVIVVGPNVGPIEFEGVPDQVPAEEG